ncbi:signal transducing kinase of the PAK [Thoreauomyces humboldtii]|nr:signal transducing kinase of the PAK [Thoreauomyces humboldtii]
MSQQQPHPHMRQNSMGHDGGHNNSTSNMMSPELYGSSYAGSNESIPPMSLNTQDSRDDMERVMETSPNNRYAKVLILGRSLAIGVFCGGWLLRRTRIGTNLQLDVLGKGAYKVVYKAIDREEGYEVAWNTCQTTKAEFMELSEEIEILKRVRHPNIIQFHDCWYNNTEFVFITELMTSGTLREYIRKLQMPNMKIVKRWARQILKGLSYLHSHDPPIIHRDIKCDNIFINGAHGEVKIGDMGTAKMKLGKKYTVIGTPEFMAPEMYEEKGYSEKVDIYAFGMALLEMVTGEYPYNECKNAAQIYKKVTQGIKPECLSRAQDPEVLDLINSCIGNEHDRLSAQEIIEHPFLALEPEVVLVMTENKTHLTMQVVFKGMDKLSVKFEFNVDTDTAEEVVNEMIQEQVLPARYQHLITGEINRILREMNKPAPEEDKNREESRQPGWVARTNSVTSSQQQQQQQQQQTDLESSRTSHSHEDTVSSNSDSGMLLRKASLMDGKTEEFVDLPHKEYADDRPIEEMVMDTAIATKRGVEKANEWLAKLKNQDIMTVGDMRELHEEDWASLGLTVFASRALKNVLYGKPARPTPQNSRDS